MQLLTCMHSTLTLPAGASCHGEDHLSVSGLVRMRRRTGWVGGSRDTADGMCGGGEIETVGAGHRVGGV